MLLGSGKISKKGLQKLLYEVLLSISIKGLIKST